MGKAFISVVWEEPEPLILQDVFRQPNYLKTRVIKGDVIIAREELGETGMKAMVMPGINQSLHFRDVSLPGPADMEVLLKVTACGVCRTDLHVLEGDLPAPKLPLILGHEIVGTIEECGRAVTSLSVGDRVGCPWLGRTCMQCRYCIQGQENLCDYPQFTGYTLDGGYAQYAIADARFCFPIPAVFSDSQAAPLLCAGLIGWRSLKFTGEAKKLGIYGFGAAAHIIAQVAIHQGRQVFAFTSPGDRVKQDFARSLGAVWSGGSDEPSPELLDAGIIFASAGHLIPKALQDLSKGGILVCGGIHMSEIPAFSYKILWGERSLKSVANLTRADGDEFLKTAAKIGIKPITQTFPLEDANAALLKLKQGNLQGAAVLLP